jgi:hypothetical protein
MPGSKRLDMDWRRIADGAEDRSEDEPEENRHRI